MGKFGPSERAFPGGRIFAPLSRGRQAASVLEMLVGLAVFALVTSLIAVAFTLAHRYTRVYHQLSSAERECVRGLERMSDILRQSAAESLQPVTAVNVCWALNSVPLQFNDSGQLLYQKWSGVWCQSDGQLLQAEIGLQGGPAVLPDALLLPRPADISAFQAVPSHHLMAVSVRRFQVTPGSNLVHLEIETQTTESGNPATRYLLSSSIPTQ